LAHQLDDSDPSLANMCRMVIASLFGFIVAAQFVTLVGLEIPYYVLLIGTGLLKLSSSAEVARASVEYTEWCEDLSPAIVA
jgi:hypothetical protein